MSAPADQKCRGILRREKAVGALWMERSGHEFKGVLPTGALEKHFDGYQQVQKAGASHSWTSKLHPDLLRISESLFSPL